MESDADKPSRFKVKNKKPKAAKKKKSESGPSCSMFLAELSRKLAQKRRQEEEEAPSNVVQEIIDSLTNALPVTLVKKSPPKKDSALNMKTLQDLAPELVPNNFVEVTPAIPPSQVDIKESNHGHRKFKMPRMPVENGEVIKLAVEKTKPLYMEDVAVNTGNEHDVVCEITKYVGTLRKISLIAEEFNQKTAKNLKDIVDSVQEDLLKKLEEAQKELAAKAAAAAAAEAAMDELAVEE